MQNVASIPLSTAALTLHYFCTAFTPTLRYFCVAFSMYLHCFCCASISTEFALRLQCICTALAISTELHWFAIFGTWDSVALCHPLNYIRECKLFKRWTKIQIHITLTKSQCTLVDECKTRKTMPCTIPWSDAFNCNEKSQWRMKYLLCANVECNKLVKLWRCEGWSLRWLNSGRHIFGVFYISDFSLGQ